MITVDGPILHTAPDQIVSSAKTLPVGYFRSSQSFFAVIDKWQLTGRTLSADDYICERAEDERQKHLLSMGVGSRSDLTDDDYLPSYHWNGFLEAIQTLFKRPDRHFRRPRDNWYEDQDQDIEKRRGAISSENSSEQRFELGLTAHLRSSRRKGFGFVNSAGDSVAYSGRIHLSVRSGFADASCITHRRGYYGGEMLFIEIVADFAKMKFVHEQLLARRSALLGLSLDFDHLERAGSPAGDQKFFIPRNRSTLIRATTFQVNDGEWDQNIIDARAA